MDDKLLALREEIRSRDRYRCAYCGVPETSGYWDIDHYLPKSTYPALTYDKENLVLSCPFCNQSKGNYFPKTDNDGLLHPRKDNYPSHMRELETGELVPITDRGRLTIDILKLNRKPLILWRREQHQLRLMRSGLLENVLVLQEQLTRSRDSNTAEETSSDEFVVLADLYRRLLQQDDKPLAISENGEIAKIEVIDWVITEKELTPYLMTYLKKHPGGLDSLDPFVFEQVIAEYFASIACDVKLLGRNPRTGADILAIRTDDPVGIEIRYMIEVKRWKDKVGIEVIDRVLGAMVREKPSWGWDVALIVSLSGFKNMRGVTPDYLDRIGIRLKGREDVVGYLRAYKPRPDGGLWLPEGWDMMLQSRPTNGST